MPKLPEMSTFKVTAEKLVVHPHPNADALELAQVGGYRAVVPKGQYKSGDVAIYIPEQAVLPDELIGELGLTGKLAGKDKNRVKAIRLPGELSQGIVCRPKEIAGAALDRDRRLQEQGRTDGTDWADMLGITKWVPPIPVNMSGKVEPAPDLLSWCEIENIKRYPDIFEPGEPVIATEKIHGTCCLLTYVRATGQVLVSSKGFGSKHLAIVEEAGNLYWRAVRAHGVDVTAKRLADELDVDRVGIYGEVYGQGVQDLHYGDSATAGVPGYAVFDIKLGLGDRERWLGQDEMTDWLADLAPSLPKVPRLYEGPYDVDVQTKLAEGAEQLSGTKAHLREGLVVRPAVERRSDVTGGRAIAKFVSEAYLTRKGGTEFE